MKFIDLTCPKCSALLEVNTDDKIVYCEYCGAKLLLDDEKQHFQFDDAETMGYNFEKGRLRALHENQQINQPVNQQKNPYIVEESNHNHSVTKQSKKRRWLWILGWIFVFPVPLTILMRNNQKLDKKIKNLIIVVAWIAYFIIVLEGNT